MVRVVGVLLLDDGDGPEALCALCFLGWGVVVAFVRVGLLDAQREEGEREELEGAFGGGAVGYGGEEGVLFARFFVGGGLEGAEGAFDCRRGWGQLIARRVLHERWTYL